jgi:hypothetical protein
MSPESVHDPKNTEIGNIAIATDLLRRMLQELQDLKVNNARLHFAMSNGEHSMVQRLDMLSGIAELLRESHPPLRTRELCQRAKKLIFQLAGELERLALKAEHEFEWNAYLFAESLIERCVDRAARND